MPRMNYAQIDLWTFTEAPYYFDDYNDYVVAPFLLTWLT